LKQACQLFGRGSLRPRLKRGRQGLERKSKLKAEAEGWNVLKGACKAPC
jgi:hypothetical protein